MAHWDGMPPGNNVEHWQAILNQAWPLVDEKGNRHARGIPSRDPIAVLVRIEFERDGETWLEGKAIRWHGRCVRIEVDDPRMQTRGVWVDAVDVRRMAGG